MRPMLFIAMAGFNTLRIARASFLRSLSPDLLLSFLHPYREYLLSCGFIINERAHSHEIFEFLLEIV